MDIFLFINIYKKQNIESVHTTYCNPYCGTAGFLVAASEYLNDHYSTEIFANPEAAKRSSEETFFGYASYWFNEHDATRCRKPTN